MKYYWTITRKIRVILEVQRPDVEIAHSLLVLDEAEAACRRDVRCRGAVNHVPL